MLKKQIFGRVVCDGKAGRSLPMLRAYAGNDAVYAIYPQFDVDGIRMKVSGGAAAGYDAELCRCEGGWLVTIPASALPSKGEKAYQVIAVNEVENDGDDADDTPSEETQVCGEGILRVYGTHVAASA